MTNISYKGSLTPETKYQPADYHLSASTLTPHFLERIGPMESSTSPTSTTQLPPLTKIIRKSSIVGLLGLFLGGLLWCMMQTVQMIHHWRLPGNSRNPLQWPVFEAYLLLGAEICLFVVVTMFASMIPSLIMTWITAVVFNYLFGKRTGRERHEKLVRSASDLAKEMSWTTLKSAVREGNLVGAGLVTLCLGTWLLGTTDLFQEKSIYNLKQTQLVRRQLVNMLTCLRRWHIIPPIHLTTARGINSYEIAWLLGLTFWWRLSVSIDVFVGELRTSTLLGLSAVEVTSRECALDTEERSTGRELGMSPNLSV